MMKDLKTGDTHVWYLWPEHVTDTERLEFHAQILSNEERARGNAFRFESDRHSHILTRVFLRTLLSRYTSVEPRDWEFSRNRHGKPVVSGPAGAPHIGFNISHTKGLIAGVFAWNPAIGIDVEMFRQSVDELQIAHNYLSPAEYSALCRLESSDRRRRFLEYWTLKEAYVKAQGVGISSNLTAFTFHIDEERARISFDPDNPEDPGLWKFRLLKPSPDYTVAIAVKSSSDFHPDIGDATSLLQ